MESESSTKDWIRTYFFPDLAEITLKDIGLILVYFLGISASVVAIALLSLMISNTSPFNCNFPSGDPLSNSALSESLDALQISYEKASDFAIFKNGLRGTSLSECFQECAFRTCYIPELENTQNCKVTCSSYGTCISQCEVCDRKVATQEAHVANTCISADDCAHFGFK